MCLLTDYGTSTKEDTCRFQESIDRHAITKTQGTIEHVISFTDTCMFFGLLNK